MQDQHAKTTDYFWKKSKKTQTNDETHHLHEMQDSILLRCAAAAAKSHQLCPTLLRPHRRQLTKLPSLGFSRQEYWSGLLFASPVHESEKWKWSRSVLSNSSWPHGLQPTRLLRPWDFPGNSTGVGCHCLLRLGC